MSDSITPYATPEAESSLPLPTDGGVIPASQGARFLNLIIDYFAFFGISFCVGFFGVLVGGQAAMDFFDRTPGAHRSNSRSNVLQAHSV